MNFLGRRKNRFSFPPDVCHPVTGHAPGRILRNLVMLFLNSSLHDAYRKGKCSMLLQKKIFYILVAAALAAILGGCGGPEISSEGTKGGAQTEEHDPAAADIRSEGSASATETSSERGSDALETPEEESGLPIAVSLRGGLYRVYSLFGGALLLSGGPGVFFPWG